MLLAAAISSVVFIGKHLLYAKHLRRTALELWSSHRKKKPEKRNTNSKSCAFTYNLARMATRRQWDFKDRSFANSSRYESFGA